MTVGFTVDPVNRQLMLAHPLIQAAWTWDAQGHIHATHLSHVPTSTEWIDPTFRSQLYRPWFRTTESGTRDAESLLSGPSHPDLQPPTTTVEPDGRAHATWQMTPTDQPLGLTWHLEAFPDHAVIRQWVEIINNGSETVAIPDLPVFFWVFGAGPRPLTAHSGLERRHYRGRDEWPDWFTWNTQELSTGAVGRVHSGYRRAATWLALTSPNDGPGLVVGWESNAQATCNYGDLNGDGSLILDCALHPDYQLAPGQTLTGPAGFTLLAAGDLDELSYRCHRFVDEVLAWRAEEQDERFPHVTFNSWGYGADIDDASMRRCFDICTKLGIEQFVVDFGWEDPDWYPLKDRFPNGLAPLADAAHAAGMLFGIHLSFGNLSNLSGAYQEHPEWGNGPGQWAYHREGRVYGLTLANPATRDWLVETLVRIVDENKIDHFLTDHYLWGPVNPAAQNLHATDDYMTIAEGFDDVLARFHALRPNVLLEHCDNGIGLPTFKMVQQHATSIGPDAVGSLYERVHTWRISRVLPPRYLDHYVCDFPKHFHYVGSGLTDYDYRSHIFGGPMILMTAIKTLEEGSEDWLALERAVALAKRVRRKILSGKVLHLLEPQPLEQVGRAWDGWDAIGSHHESSDSAVIFAFRLGGAVDTRTIPLHGLNPSSTYQITFADRPTTYTTSGANLLTHGISLSLPAPGHPPTIDLNGMLRASEVIFLDPVPS